MDKQIFNTKKMPAGDQQRKVVGFLLIFLAGVLVGRYLLMPTDSNFTQPEFVTVEDGERQFTFEVFWEAWDLLHEKYTDELADDDLFYGAVAGMVAAAGDPYTVFADPASTEQFEGTIEGSFSGVGIEIGMRGGIVTVIAPLDGSPAHLAGIREGDLIVAVDEEPITMEMSLDEVVQRIRGEKGTRVTLTVAHVDGEELEDIEIVRGTIEIESVKFEMEDNIAHISITSFNGDTEGRFTTIARQATRLGAQGVVLDLRNNPGGYLQSSVEIASRFLAEDTLVVTERGNEAMDYVARGNDLLKGIPVVVLVNGGSASASEILAGALNDQIGSPLVGTKTFGKGSVQELLKLKDGSSLRVTVAKWFTPKGRNIDEEGIEPGIVVEQDYEKDEDEPLLRAMEEMKRIINE